MQVVFSYQLALAYQEVHTCCGDLHQLSHSSLARAFLFGVCTAAKQVSTSPCSTTVPQTAVNTVWAHPTTHVLNTRQIASAELHEQQCANSMQL
jgi:hypothetical protein